MHRPSIGIIAILLLAAAALLGITQADNDAYQGLYSACLRIGLVMAVLWLAHPQVQGMPVWVLFGCVAVVLAGLLFMKPRMLVLALVILFVVTRIGRLTANVKQTPRSR